MIPCKVLKNHLVFQPKDLVQVRTIFPALRESPGTGYVAVPHTLEASRLLRNMGVDAPSPIRTEYGWPIRRDWKPRWWQEETAEFLSLNPRAHCHDAMRLGKTMATLWALDYLKKKRVVNKALIVAPLSSLELAWGDNLFMNFHHLSFAVLHGSAEKRRKLLAQNHDVYIINHDGVEILLKELMERKDINLVVVDEVHEYFRATTKKWKALNQVVNNRGIPTLAWGLTGTPMSEGRPTDAFGQAKLIRPEAYKGHFTRFKNDTMYQISQFKWGVRKGSEQIVQQVLSPSIRHERSVVTDIEPCLIERHAELSEQQRKHINELLKQSTTEIRESTVTAVNAAVLIQKIVQASCGVVYGSNGEFLRIDFGPRLQVLEEVIAENNEKILVFIPFRGALHAVAKELQKRWTVEVVDGGVSVPRRNQIFTDFQTKKDPHIIVAHPQTMAYSLCLDRASLVVWYAPYPANKTYDQANARPDGSGQKAGKIDICHISATATERRIYAALREKGRLQDVVLELLNEAKKRK